MLRQSDRLIDGRHERRLYKIDRINAVLLVKVGLARIGDRLGIGSNQAPPPLAVPVDVEDEFHVVLLVPSCERAANVNRCRSAD